MFTGIIQQVSAVKAFSKSGSSALLTIDMGKLDGQIKIGDSIDINGVCLTIAKLAGSIAAFDISKETLDKSTLGKLKAGSKVNVELAMQAQDRFGGHFVLGHVDGTATIKKFDKSDDFANFTFTASKELIEQMIPKGSVAVNGISLTIAELKSDSFTVAVIPQTLKETTLGQVKINEQVNIEIDIITKTVRRHLQQLLPAKKGLTFEDLQQQGF